MKTFQWILAVLCLAIMVFAITFVVIFTGTGPVTPRPTSPQADAVAQGKSLTFETQAQTQRFPPQFDGQAWDQLDWEHGKPGFHDFWFSNEEDQPIQVALNGVSCKCGTVEVFTLPAGSPARKSVPPSTMAGLGGLASLAAERANDRALAKVEAEHPGILLGKQAKAPGPTIQPGEKGWIRVHWTGENTGLQTLSAELFMGSTGIPQSEKFEIHIDYLPIIAFEEMHPDVKTLRPEDLDFHVNFYCYSSTRDSFRLEVKRAKVRSERAEKSFRIDKPVALSPAECQALEKRLIGSEATKTGSQGKTVKSGYRIPITLMGKAENGVPFDLGPFRRRILVNLVPDDPNAAVPEPYQLTVTGLIEGDIRVGSPEDEGRIAFGSFRTSVGCKRAIVLQTSNPDIKLEFDRKSTPDFLEADLPAQPEVYEGQRIWRMEVRVLPGKMSGQFPDERNLEYQDTAIHLRTTGPTPQYLRIPVSGVGTDDSR